VQSLSKRLPLSLLIGGPILLGLALLWWSFRPFGIGVGLDGSFYTSFAENLRRGFGYATSIVPWGDSREVAPVSQWTPLYMLILAAMIPFPPVVAAAVLNSLLFAANSALVAGAVYHYTDRRFATVLASLTMVVAPAVWLTHSVVLTESLFICLILLTLWAQDRYRISGQDRYWMLAAGGAAATVLTRYMGIALVASGLILVILMSRGSWRRRLGVGLGYSSLVAVPLGLWTLRNRLVVGQIAGAWPGADRTLPQFLGDSWAAVWGWFDSTLLPGPWAGLGGLLVVGSSGYLLYSRQGAQRLSGRLWGYGLFAVCYSGLLLLESRLVGTGGQASRYLAPVFPVLVVILLSLLFGAPADAARPPTRATRLAWAALVVGLVLLPLLGTVRQVTYIALRTQGSDYRAAKWRLSPTVQAVAQSGAPFAAGTRIYSNAPDVLWLYSDRSTHFLPSLAQGEATALADLHQVLIAAPSVIVYVRINATVGGMIQEPAVATSPQFRRIAQYADGAVYAPVP